MKLSELSPDSYKVVDQQTVKPVNLRLSDFPHESIKVIEPEQYKEAPAVNEPDSALGRFAARISDPDRWKAIAFGTGPYAPKMVSGTPPLVAPAAALPKIAALATKLNSSVLARVPIAAAQGAIQGAATTPADRTIGERAENVKSGAKWATGIQVAAESIPVLGKFAKAAGGKIASALTGISDDIIRNYASRTDQVNKIIAQSGREMPAAADKMRTELQDAIRSTRQNLSKTVSDTIGAAPKKPSVQIQPIIDSLESAKARLDPIFHAEAIGQINGMISMIQQGAVPAQYAKQAGLTNAKYLNLIKEYLQGRASMSYMQNGQIFQQGPQASQAAKGAAAVARKMLNQAVPEVAKANNQLSALHSLENSLNKNLIAPGKPDAALFAAGSGGNPRNAKMLDRLGQITGTPALEKAKDLATAREFANPSILPVDSTGKAAARVLVAGGIGGLVAGPLGTGIAAATTSPLTLKLGVNALNIARQLTSGVPSFGQMIRDNPVAAQTIIGLVGGQIREANRKNDEISPEVEEFFRVNPKMLDNVKNPKTRALIKGKIERAPTAIDRRLQSK